MGELIPSTGDEIVVQPAPTYAIFSTFGWFSATILLILVGLYFRSVFPAMLSLPIGLLAIYRYAYLVNIKYIITPQQIFYRKGIFNREVEFLELYRVRDFKVNQSVLMRISKTMKVTLLTVDRGEPVLILQGIPVSDLVQTIRNYVQECRSKNHILTVDA